MGEQRSQGYDPRQGTLHEALSQETAEVQTSSQGPTSSWEGPKRKPAEGDAGQPPSSSDSAPSGHRLRSPDVGEHAPDERGHVAGRGGPEPREPHSVNPGGLAAGTPGQVDESQRATRDYTSWRMGKVLEMMRSKKPVSWQAAMAHAYYAMGCDNKEILDAINHLEFERADADERQAVTNKEMLDRLSEIVEALQDLRKDQVAFHHHIQDFLVGDDDDPDVHSSMEALN